ncbi:SRPBCC family protein [Halalkalibacter nanhaiisediminis]|uniref:Ligand-binding SRPBCC domain-containing protein n=1 Tax=Halalkalibacter nanhaiisediminis TaxID=688079 RepID=A0A562QNV7_9BACI|nr:SRPBCC family protein [Halalkalibacter nanhaiisediminis]TWI57880.1 hypothetical protein IQ10_01209 [Halalkalibacter nanhaiisediminis]
MNVLVFRYTTVVKAPIEEVWRFFSTAENLATITAFPNVNILSNPETKTGNEIEMKLSVAGVGVKWISLIEEVEPPFRFVDTGLKLPFPFTEWRHEHAFAENGAETIMTDTIMFRASMPSFITKALLENMFKGREKAIAAQFTNSK